MDYFVVYSKDGKRRLYKSKSYQACADKEKEIEHIKNKIKEAKNGKK